MLYILAIYLDQHCYIVCIVSLKKSTNEVKNLCIYIAIYLLLIYFIIFLMPIFFQPIFIARLLVVLKQSYIITCILKPGLIINYFNELKR